MRLLSDRWEAGMGEGRGEGRGMGEETALNPR